MARRIPGWILTLFIAAAATGCGVKDRPDSSTAGLGQECPQTGCAQGQQCVEAAAAGGATRTCEIKCANDADCPEGTRCNLPPVVPDSIPNTCQSSSS